MNFKVLQNDPRSFARVGELELAHGKVQTPIFMPVGTHGTVRGLGAHELEATGSEIMLANTYHLLVRPGIETIEKLEGLHSFMRWNRPILTDSGGFQIFSLSGQRKITDENVTFTIPQSGDKLTLSPEDVVRIQERWGSDIMMCLDECPPATATPGEIERAVARTALWAQRSKEAHRKKDLGLFCINQGGCHQDLRERSLRQLLEVEQNRDPWQGMAIGGLSVGEEKADFVRTLFGLRSLLPTDRPRYLMGVGTPRDLVFAVACGVDMFDCVIPSRNGRHGIVMTFDGKRNLFNAQYAEDSRPIDENCPCLTCSRYSRALLRHLFSIGDTLAGRLATLHNIVYFLELMKRIRAHLANGSFAEWTQDFMHDPKHCFLGVEKSFAGYPDSFHSCSSS